MPLVLCPSCEARIAADALTCPRCGAPLRRTRPGATTGGSAVLVVLALLVGVPLGVALALAAAQLGVPDSLTVGAGFAGLLAPVGLALLWSHRAR